ncbi:XRE family transcriptional regulator [Marinomonas sp. CT5]|uniref:helix-turn-helix transcriptional regulator n=1 Tax=Marinomonas sp. CT5 TaxID=2066133 RepID=UPI001BAF3244|nr:helix-turn-helix transcriptional regulator [Marinomonas sp. CT5]QUX97263.1 XRE family transcriptional regulator [Marinomonas sp. CT5]
MSNKDGRVPLNADALKEHRRRIGLSQEKLAEQCLKKGLHVSISSIKRAELGTNVLYRTAKQLAQFYNVPVETLFLESIASHLDEKRYSSLKREV